MKKIIVAILSLGITLFGNTQTFKPKINIGIAFRGSVHEIEKARYRSYPYNFHYYPSAQSNCQSLSIDVVQDIFGKNWKVELSNYFRYNYFRETQATPASNLVTEKRFKSDHFFDIFYNPALGKKKDWKLKIGIGYGVTNTNTAFNYPRFTGEYDANGNPIIINSFASFQYDGLRAFVGASYKKMGLTIAVFDSKNNNNEDLFSLWIETKFAYSF